MLSLTQAAKIAGKGKITIARDIKNGTLSASRAETGGWQIDPAELRRVYPSVDASPEPDQSPELDRPGPDHLADLDWATALWREQLADRDATIADLRTRLDRSDDERRKLTERLLAPPPPKPWWKRLLLS